MSRSNPLTPEDLKAIRERCFEYDYEPRDAFSESVMLDVIREDVPRLLDEVERLRRLLQPREGGWEPVDRNNPPELTDEMRE